MSTLVVKIEVPSGMSQGEAESAVFEALYDVPEAESAETVEWTP